MENSLNRLLDHFGSTKEERVGNEAELAKVVLGLAVRLEAQATTLLISSLPKDNKGQLLLRADRNLQRRALEQLELGTDKEGFWTHGTLALEKEMREEVHKAEDVATSYLDPRTGETDTVRTILLRFSLRHDA